MRQSLPANFFDLYNEASGVDVFTIAMLAVNGLLGMAAQPHALSLFATGSSERAGRVGHTYGSMVKRFCTIGWALTGLIVAAMIARSGDQLPDKEHAFGYACLHLLGPGWVGLMVACVLAANMSACSNLMVNTGALFTQNIYKKYVNTRPEDRRLLLVGRFSGLGLTLLGVLFALVVDQVLQAFLFTETIAALMGIMFVGGLLWRRANRYGAAAATAAAFLLYYAVNYYHNAGQLQLVYVWKATPFAWAVTAGFAALWVVSWLTPAEDPAKIAIFFDNMNRSTDGAAFKEGETRVPAAERGQDLLLLDLPGWFTAKRWRAFGSRYREDLIGFALAWAAVGLLVLAAWALMQLGR
jgi:Na+/proline symporter